MTIPELSAVHKETNLAKINNGLAEILSSNDFVDYVHSMIDDKRVLKYLPDFKITIISNHDNRGGQPHEVTLQFARFKYLVNTFEDLLEQFIHDTLHEIAWIYWKKCPVKYSDLSEQEADVFDEIWNQAYVYHNFPHLHNLHIEYVTRCIEYAHKDPDKISDILCLFDVPNKCNGLNGMSFVHKWIYAQEDVAQQRTFNTFMQMCIQSLKDPKSKKMIAKYNKLLNGKNK